MHRPSADPTHNRISKAHWGAHVSGPGSVRFRLWAPGQPEVRVAVDGVAIPMLPVADGWFEVDASAVPGSHYEFVFKDGSKIADPASRGQYDRVDGPSVVVDPSSYSWQASDWMGRPWEEAVILELHIGTFTPGGTFRSAIERLASLAEIGITAVEIMPVAQFEGVRGWGYDGVLLYAPHNAYGTPDDMRAFVDAAHHHGIMVFLDVVYNHFGPVGNDLARIAPDFFHPDKHTPWGAAIAYEHEPVRAFFIDNALYWLTEFRLDGLRFDAIDQIEDIAPVHILNEIAERIRSAFPGRHIHLATEDNRNITVLHERDDDGKPRLYTAEWNDDFHHVAHVLSTGQTDGYYGDFEHGTFAMLARALAEGYVYQGEVPQRTGGAARGVPSGHLPPAAFVNFLQNHDQIGNRAFGERMLALSDPEIVKALTAVLLLSPQIPLMFMGEQFGSVQPFYFFTDFTGDLATAVREGRAKEFADLAGYGNSDEDSTPIPDPNTMKTFTDCILDWSTAESPDGIWWQSYVTKLLAVRRDVLVPYFGKATGHCGRIEQCEDDMLSVRWQLGSRRFTLGFNNSSAPRMHSGGAEVAFAFPDTAEPDWRETGMLAAGAVMLTYSDIVED